MPAPILAPLTKGRRVSRVEQRWHLFLDESGDFLEGRDPVACVAGLLLRDEAPQALATNLRTLLERAAPIAQYPLHTSHANMSAWWLASWALATDAQRVALAKLHPREAALLPVWSIEARARLADDPSQRPFFEAIDARRMPGYDALVAVRRGLVAKLPEVHRAIEGLTVHVRQRMAAMLDLVAEAYTDRGCHLVAGAWFPQYDAHGALEGSHYLHALSTLFERIVATLSERGPERHCVEVHAGRLELAHPILSAGRRTFLSRPMDIGLAARDAARSPLAPAAPSPDRATVRFVADVPAAFDANVHPGIVFADFLSNTLWRSMNSGGTNASWSDLSSCLALRRFAAPDGHGGGATLRFEAPLRRAASPQPHAPMVAVSGAPAEFVRAAWRGETESGARFEAPTRWAREQAERWASFARTVQS